MQTIRQLGGALAILIVVTSCAAATGKRATTLPSSPTLPTCEKALIGFNQLSTSLPTKAHIPKTDPGPMRFCRYRWDNTENKLALVMDEVDLKAPLGILQTLNKLKTMNEVYGLNAAFACPLMQGNADVIILQGARSKLTFIKIQRDGCQGVIVMHPGSHSYVAYVTSTLLLVQLDAITPIGGRPKTRALKIQVTPSTNLRDGQRVLVKVTGGSPGERFRISACATASAANKFGCGEQMALEPFIDADPSGSGSTTLIVRTKAAIKPYNTADLQPCTSKCVVMTTGTNNSGQFSIVYARVSFHPSGNQG